MKISKVKIGELNFEMRVSDDPDLSPILEIENDASMVFLNVDQEKAQELKVLLEDYLSEINRYQELTFNT